MCDSISTPKMHIRFTDEGEERKASHAQAGPSGVTPMHCMSTIRADFDQQDACYVFELCHSPQTGLVAARLSNKRIKLFSLSGGGLQFVGELTGHTGGITDAQWHLPDEPHLLHSCGRDGCVIGWDTRSGQAAEQYAAPRAELLSCATNGQLVAAGGGDRVLFWDRRSRRPLASFDDTHAQEVTHVRFHPAQHSMLVSASEDGLVAVFDTAPELDEDEGFKAGLNIDTAPARLGFYGPAGAKLWCTSTTEGLHLWEWAAACDDGAAGGAGPLAAAPDARAALAAAAGAAGPAAGAVASELDYLVGCEYAAPADQLWVLAGTSGGAVGVFPVTEPAPGGGGALFGPPAAVLAGGHCDVVRSVVWPAGLGAGGCLSGGEDARVCTWSTAPAATAGPSGSTSSSDSAVRRQREHTRRAAPY